MNHNDLYGWLWRKCKVHRKTHGATSVNRQWGTVTQSYQLVVYSSNLAEGYEAPGPSKEDVYHNAINCMQNHSERLAVGRKPRRKTQQTGRPIPVLKRSGLNPNQHINPNMSTCQKLTDVVEKTIPAWTTCSYTQKHRAERREVQ